MSYINKDVNAVPVYLIDGFTGQPVNLSAMTGSGTTLDDQGNVVPIYKAHSYIYDNSGNLSSDTVTDSTGVWVRSYTYQPTGVATDSGWVKQ